EAGSGASSRSTIQLINNLEPVRINVGTIKDKTAAGAWKIPIPGKEYRALFNYEGEKSARALVIFRMKSGEKPLRINRDELLKGTGRTINNHTYWIQYVCGHIVFVPIDKILIFNQKLEAKMKIIPVSGVLTAGAGGFTVDVEGKKVALRFKREKDGEKIEIVLDGKKVTRPFLKLLSGLAGVALKTNGKEYMISGNGRDFALIPEYMLKRLVEDHPSISVTKLDDITRKSGEEFTMNGRDYRARYQEETVKRGTRQGLIPSIVIRDIDAGREFTVPYDLLIKGYRLRMGWREYYLKFDRSGETLIIEPVRAGRRVRYDEQEGAMPGFQTAAKTVKTDYSSSPVGISPGTRIGFRASNTKFSLGLVKKGGRVFDSRKIVNHYWEEYLEQEGYSRDSDGVIRI
ncbi:MAG: hypothetical protein KAS66_11380, partial [Candidatus Omnitrophica bacterium]|nr:hypothetical protein [Candidatus Omnitrophota bacterium]